MTKLDDDEKNMLEITCLENIRTNFEKEKEGMELMTTRLLMGFNDVRNTPIEIGFI
jgi:hypothetical protein